MTNSMTDNNKVQNIGLFGGTFDPIHLGHIKVAKHLSALLGLSRLSLVPCHIPVHKKTSGITSEHRKNMVQLICKQEPLFHCDSRELNKHAPSYTVDTLTEIKAEQPNSRLFFFIGMDSLQTFTTWHRWQDILNLCHLVVNSRPGYQASDNNQATNALLQQYQIDDIQPIKEKRSGTIWLAPKCDHDISSSHIRALLTQQQNVAHLLPETVSNYINHYKLYR